MGKLVPEVSVCAEEGNEAGGLKGKPSEEHVHPVADLAKRQQNGWFRFAEEERSNLGSCASIRGQAYPNG